MSDRGMSPQTRKYVMYTFAIMTLVLLPLTLFAVAYFIQHPTTMNESFLPDTWRYPFIAMAGIGGVVLAVMAMTNRTSKYVTWQIFGAAILLTLAFSGWIWWFGILPAVFGVTLMDKGNNKFYETLALARDNSARGTTMAARNIAIYVITVMGGSVLLNYVMDNYEWAHKLRVVMMIVFGIVLYGVLTVFPLSHRTE